MTSNNKKVRTREQTWESSTSAKSQSTTRARSSCPLSCKHSGGGSSDELAAGGSRLNSRLNKIRMASLRVCPTWACPKGTSCRAHRTGCCASLGRAGRLWCSQGASHPYAASRPGRSISASFPLQAARQFRTVSTCQCGSRAAWMSPSSNRCTCQMSRPCTRLHAQCKLQGMEGTCLCGGTATKAKEQSAVTTHDSETLPVGCSLS
eukprot:SAG11_NODE_457_length_9306_cov_2.887803_6_plen_206_part_00